MTDNNDKILSGKEFSDYLIENEFTKKVKEIKEKYGRVPKLGTILVGNDPASKVYVANKGKLAERAGMDHENLLLPEDSTLQEVLEAVESWNRDPEITGILVQLPLPKHLRKYETMVIDKISYFKDVDGLTKENIARLYRNDIGLRPCTPKGIIRLLKFHNIEIEGKNAVIMGRSQLVGRPLGLMLLHENATVTTVHSRTRNLPEITRRADLLVAAIGRAEFVKSDMVKDGAIVIDVGINRNEEGKLVGDVAFEEVLPKVSHITPVPGGVGPMTVAMVVNNTIEAFFLQNKNE